MSTSTISGRRVLFMLCGFDLGGAERQALYLAKHLKELGCEVTVWGHHHQKQGPQRVLEICHEAGIRCEEYKFRWPCKKLDFLRNLFRLWCGLWKRKPEIVLGYTSWPNIGLGLIWRWTPAKVFIWGQRDLAETGKSRMVRLAYRNASAVICNAEHETLHLQQQLGSSRAPVHVVHNGIDLPPATKTRQQWRQELGIPDTVPMVTMLANLRTDKDHTTLLQAWKKITGGISDSQPVPRLILAGAQQNAFEQINKLTQELEISKTLLMPGQIHDIAGFLSACDIGVLSTPAEGLPNAILEYMSCGLPVLASDIPGNREALGEHAEQQLFQTGNPEDLANKLSRLLQNHELRRQLGQQNLERAHQEFTIEAMTEKMTGIICREWKENAER